MIKNKFKDTEIGEIPIDWDVKKLGEISNITMGQSPSSKTYNYEGIGEPFFQGRKDFGDKYPKITMWCTDPKKIGKKGDVLISVRAPIGDLNIAPINCCIGRGLAAISHNDLENNEFLYYLLKDSEKRLLSIYGGTGTVFSAITKGNIVNFSIPVPPLEEQEAIANTLSCLDGKIECKNKQNKILEEIAQSIYNEWFVNFNFPMKLIDENFKEEIGYKDAGGEMEFNEELGKEIPQGWKVGKLKNFFKFIKGKKPQKLFENYKNNFLEYLTINSFNSCEKQYGDPKNKVILKELDLAMVMDGASSGTLYYGKNGILGSTFSKIELLNNKFSYEYLYHVLRHYQKIISENTTGSAIPHTDKELVYNIKIPIATSKLQEEFTMISKRCRLQIIKNNIQNQQLSEIRDLLLPKLMSGQVRIPLNEEKIA
ncbi:type I restriction enzyme S subunit [Methanococcus voltae]|uniref:Type I restriction enzyme S subunit n=1 Tax=Methanococcus voltae TaxID=2188 RepID=A0A8J7RPR6_METVO|nr:restriction endonuclease subunit S [Methanococcus voltae]MBP2202009.1 type I restriction enzyme S subunit [Methanococcus voltae]